MRTTIALVTTAAFLSTLGCGPMNSGTTTPDSGGEVLSEMHYNDHGFEMNVVVSRTSDGLVVSQATAEDPETRDSAEIWTDGTTIEWTGTIDGEPVSGSAAASDLLNPEDPSVCLHPVAVLVCVGAAAALLAGCAFGFGCEGGKPATNPPESGGGGGQGGGGEGEPDEEPED